LRPVRLSIYVVVGCFKPSNLSCELTRLLPSLSLEIPWESGTCNELPGIYGVASTVLVCPTPVAATAQ
jgi:hypothetical protein